MEAYDDKKLKVINIGLQNFYDAIESQSCKVIQLEWLPPVNLSSEILDLLDKLL